MMATSVRTRLSRRLSSWSVRLDPAPADPGPAEAVPVLDIETVRLVHKEIKDRLARLDANSARLDTKATSLLGFVSAISLFLATQKIDGWLKLIAYCGLAAAGYLGFQAMRVRRYTEAPEPRLLAQQVGKTRGGGAGLADRGADPDVRKEPKNARTESVVVALEPRILGSCRGPDDHRARIRRKPCQSRTTTASLQLPRRHHHSPSRNHPMRRSSPG